MYVCTVSIALTSVHFDHVLLHVVWFACVSTLCVPVGCGLCGGAGGRVILILLFELYIVQKHLSIPRDHAFTNFFQPLLVLCVIFLSICFHFFSMSNLYLVILIGPHCSV